MGFSKKTQGDAESEAKKWVIAGFSVRSLKPINTKVKERHQEEEEEVEFEFSTTPTAKESRIPKKLAPPPPPRKRRPSRCHNSSFNGVREFFNPPDLETVFKCKVEKAK
ncbi:hypothetical protein HN51_071195 [Arachis hypogaea]|uniref:Cyclin-dependent protein kinase inhibitor SMR6 n=2 Tax=Arachis TaxID=3817 RepID=A0A445D3G6_ARAHY|nr:cyclin-dependent protein kinase inhibitor SMR6 [Arachis duranensis]XP_016200954.1 cyclin-dependent protein kinase inhibitor SMR6 [Arachis ipaensis]XP_025656338.1 cyclin-dependent protein kinase inhibitor SMR6-like [Arachis hypogaea]XP_025700674.1 cyclin-dependent protein kinase inhibitor SMR6-like [Arachis hypogaea]XP_057763324.1 cyclin-dependent protein kinase inhibitor SMR6 [Arachis stenosperma]QHO13762.1 uncharacterized protein DS421_15g518240 [Arachis hypogaea]QHO42731.1 uncharacterize